MVTTWKTDQTQWPPISEKNNAVIRYRWSQHGREIKHSDLKYQKKTMLWYFTDGHNMEERSNTVTSNIRKNNAVIRYRWSQHGRQIKHSTLQYQKNNAVIRYRWWSQHGRQIKHSTLQYQKNNAVIRYRWWSQPQRNNREDKLKDVLFSQSCLTCVLSFCLFEQ